MKNWCYDIDTITQKCLDKSLILNKYYSQSERSNFMNSLQDKLFLDFKNDWSSRINSTSGVSGRTKGNKLRQYKLFKKEYKTEHYVQSEIIKRHYRAALSKFRCGVAPLKIETGRYEALPINERICFNCSNSIEDELHVLVKCPLYSQIREALYIDICKTNDRFLMYSDSEKFIYLLSNENIVKYSAKACFDILCVRRNLLYNG
jgi:hypothetical protein